MYNSEELHSYFFFFSKEKGTRKAKNILQIIKPLNYKFSSENAWENSQEDIANYLPFANTLTSA